VRKINDDGLEKLMYELYNLTQ